MTHRAQGQAGPRAEQSVPDAPLLLTLRGAAALSVSPRTVRRLLESGDFAPVRIGRAVRVSAADLAAYVDSRITRGNTAPGVAVPETTPCQDVRPRARKDSTHTPTRRSTGVLIAEDLEGLKAQAIRAAWRAQGKAQETGERATFDDLLLLYRQQVTPAKRAPERDRRSAKALFPAFTGRVPESVKAAHVRGYIAGRTAAGITAGTINKEVGLMSAALNWARKELEWDLGNPRGSRTCTRTTCAGRSAVGWFRRGWESSGCRSCYAITTSPSRPVTTPTYGRGTWPKPPRCSTAKGLELHTDLHTAAKNRPVGCSTRLQPTDYEEEFGGRRWDRTTDPCRVKADHPAKR
jgi:excisionase family DNA binding protein